MNPKSPVCIPSPPAIDIAPALAVGERLAQAFARLQDIQVMRERLNDACFGRASEDQIVWRELLELEFQLVDDRIV